MFRSVFLETDATIRIQREVIYLGDLGNNRTEGRRQYQNDKEAGKGR